MNIAGRSHDIREQDIVIVPSSALHSASRTPGQPFCFFALVFSPSLLDRSGSDDIYRKYIAPVFENRLQFPEHIVPHSAWQQELLTLLYSIRDLFAEKAPGFELLVKARLLEIWHALAPPAPFPHPRQNPEKTEPPTISNRFSLICRRTTGVRSVSGKWRKLCI